MSTTRAWGGAEDAPDTKCAECGEPFGAHGFASGACPHRKPADGGKGIFRSPPDLPNLLRDIAGMRPDPSTCIFITPEHRMCGAPTDPKRLGLCAWHWEEIVREVRDQGTP